MSTDGSDDSVGESGDFVATRDDAAPADIIEEAEPAGEPVDDAAAETDESVAGSFAPDVAVTPQMPNPENVLFVSLGVFLSILVLAQVLPGGITPAAVVGVAVAVAVATVVCYGILTWTTPDT